MAITYQEMLDKYTSSERYTSNMRSDMLKADTAYFLSYSRESLGLQNAPQDVTVHIPSTGPAIVDHFVDQVRTGSPQVSVGTLGAGSKAQSRRDALASFGRYAMSCVERHEDEPVWDYLAFALSLYGAAAIRVLFDERRWPADPTEQKYAWPFVVRAVHPSTLYLPPGFRWPYEWVIERQQRYVADIVADYPEWKPKDRKLKADSVADVYVYQDASEYALFAGGALVMRKPNLIGVPPYSWSFSGMGHKARDGEPSSQAQGILHHVFAELQSEAAIKTAAEAMWRSTAWPTMVGTMPIEDMGSKWAVGLGRYIEVREMKEAPAYLRPAELNPQLYAMLQDVRRSIEKATYSEVLEGNRPPGVDYGVMYGMQIGQARLRVDAVKHAVERMASQVVGFTARYVDKLGLGLEIDGKKVDAGDIGGHYLFDVKFEAIDPLDNDRRAQLGLNLKQARVISHRTTLRDYLKVENVEDELEEILAEEAAAQLVAQGYVSQAAAGVTQASEDAERLAQGQQEVVASLEKRLGARRSQTPLGARRAPPVAGGEGPATTPKAGVG